MTIKKKAVKKPSDGHVQLRKIDLALDLSPRQVREVRASLKGALEGSSGSATTAQLRLGGRDLNNIYIYLSMRQLKSLVARLKALVELP